MTFSFFLCHFLGISVEGVVRSYTLWVEKLVPWDEHLASGEHWRPVLSPGSGPIFSECRRHCDVTWETWVPNYQLSYSQFANIWGVNQVHENTLSVWINKRQKTFLGSVSHDKVSGAIRFIFYLKCRVTEVESDTEIFHHLSHSSNGRSCQRWADMNKACSQELLLGLPYVGTGV